MGRSILSASLVRPVWQHGSFRIEGPDEDPFTLAVSALNRLGEQVPIDGARALQRLHLVGATSPDLDWAYGEALGSSALEVQHHPANTQGLWGALGAAAQEEGSPRREAVVAVDSATTRADGTVLRQPLHGAGAAAFVLGQEPGLAVLRHGFLGHPPGRLPSMKGLIHDWLEALGLPTTSGRGEVVFAAEDDLARWQTAWEDSAPGVTVTFPERAPPHLGPAPTIRAAFLLWELARRLRTGRTGAVVEATRGGRAFAGFRLDGPVRWLGNWGETAPGLEPPNERFFERAAGVEAVSQGAYVPHPRYVENLSSRWRLVGERCPQCRALGFPARGRCRSCGRSEGLQPEAFPRTRLQVEAVTSISPGAQPTEFDSIVAAAGGYDVAVVRLGVGTRATVQVTDTPAGHLRVGDRVDLVLRRLYPMEGEWRYGLKAVPEGLGAGAWQSESGPTSSVPPVRRPPSSSAPRGSRSTPHRPGARPATRYRRAR